jgi:hypothetical protein
MWKRWLMAVIAVVALSGCDEDTTAPRDVYPPAAPRGLRSVTGDGEARLSWLQNTESDVAGYRVYMSPCDRWASCPYERVGTTAGTAFVVPLANGVTRFFAVAAYDRAGNESALTPEDVFDTPRPAGSGLVLASYATSPATCAYDFSAYSVVPYDSPNADIFLDYDGAVHRMYAKYADTFIQDAGFTWSLDEVDFAPLAPLDGWSNDGTVELIQGHSYVVWIDNGIGGNYAKFRIVSLSAGPPRAILDWAYQIAPGNRELRAGPGRREGGRVPRPIAERG